MKTFNKYYNCALAAICLGTLSSCENPTDDWGEINAVIPANDSYVISITESTEPDSENGIYMIDQEHFIYEIGFRDADGHFLGHLDFKGTRMATNLSGTYEALPTTTLVKDDSPLRGEFTLIQNALNSITVVYEGDDVISFSKGIGIPEYTRPIDTECTKKYLLSKSLPNQNGTYSYTLSTGSNGVNAEAGFVDVYGGSGEYVQLKFVCSSPELEPGNYEAGTLDDPRAGTFVIGTPIETEWFSYIDGSQLVTMENDEYVSVKRIVGGSIDVSLIDDAERRMAINGYLIGEEGNVFEINYIGGVSETGSHSPDPLGELTYSDEISDVTSFDFTTMTQTVIPGIKQHVVTISDADKSVAACFTFITKEGTSDYSGIYTVAESAAAEGLMNNGYDFSAFGMGIGGSYRYDNGELVLLQPGEEVKVTDSSDRTLTFEGEGFSISAVPEGVTPEGPEVTAPYRMVVEKSDVYTPSFELVAGVKTHNITLMDGEDKIAVLALILPDDADTYEGTFRCVENACEAYQMVNGFDMSMWGLGMGGSYWYDNGILTLVNAGETLTVALSADVYTFEGKGFLFNGKF